MFAQRGIEILFTPIYSSELNAAEFCFSKIKTLVKQSHYRAVFKENIPFGIYETLKEITPADCAGFYRKVGYLNM